MWTSRKEQDSGRVNSISKGFEANVPRAVEEAQDSQDDKKKMTEGER